MILLDTHAAVWLANDEPVLGQKSCSIALAARAENQLAISAISFWEIALLAAKDRQKYIVDRPNFEQSCSRPESWNWPSRETSHYSQSN